MSKSLVAALKGGGCVFQGLLSRVKEGKIHWGQGRGGGLLGKRKGKHGVRGEEERWRSDGDFNWENLLMPSTASEGRGSEISNKIREWRGNDSVVLKDSRERGGRRSTKIPCR